MKYSVVKPFKTPNRKFAMGASVNDGDDLAPHTIEGLMAGGFVALPSAASLGTVASAPARSAAAIPSQAASENS